MSRFIENLTSLHKAEPQPMGFMLSRPATKKARLQLLALAPAENLDKVIDSLNETDAVLVKVARSGDIDAMDKVCQDKNEILIGGWLKSTRENALEKAMESTCDFLVFTPEVPLTITQKDKLGRILETDISLSEGLLRTVNDLPVDAVLASGKDEEISLTLNRLMFIQRLAYLVTKPILVSVPDDLTQEALQTLWEMGISGIVVEAADEKSGERLSELRKSIDKLSPSAFRKKSRISATLPRMQPETPAPVEEEEGGDEDE